ncbi:MAG: ABC transporter permease [Candidatus Choladocola sp.]|nr:ABC transporter permease [Candidatus Choladocola sp.]
MLNNILSPDFFNAILRATTPILFATLAAGVAAKSGITNMALEGMLLFASLFGVIFSSMTHSFLGGLLITMVIGGLIGLILAFFILQLKTDEILAAIALNLIATGGTVLLLLSVSGDRGASTSISSVSAPTIRIAFLEGIPFIGKVISGQNLMTYLALIAVVVVHIFLYKTPMGLKIRAVGENKNAAESVGISSKRIQYIALVISGVLCSMGGYFLSGGYMNMFTKDMSAGKGFIALAASSMGGNTPVGGFLVSLLFGAAQALANLMQLTTIPMELVQMIPYLTTLIGLGIYSYVIMKRKARLSGK